jgi:hypothetical protein
MRFPDVFVIVQEELWRLPDDEARRLWLALSRSRWSRWTRLRQELMLVGHVRLTEACLAAIVAIQQRNR